MGKSSHFSGQPQPKGAKMDEKVSDHRLDHNHAILQYSFQRSRQTSQDRQKEGRHKGTYGHTRQRGCSV